MLFLLEFSRCDKYDLARIETRRLHVLETREVNTTSTYIVDGASVNSRYGMFALIQWYVRASPRDFFSS